MTRVHLHFAPGMEKTVREGRKVASSWRTCKAQPGDTFVLDGGECRVVDVFRCELSNIRDALIWLE